LFISAGYLLLIGWATVYSATCEEMFCHFAMFYAGLPWTLFLSVIINFDSFSLAGWVIVTFMFAFFNIALLYILLGEDKVVKSVDTPDEV